MKQRILITGGSGLLAINWALTVLDRFDVILCLHKRQIRILGLQVINVELGSFETLARLLKELKPCIVIHTAGITNIEACELDKESAYQVNVLNSYNVAKTCSFLGIKLVHISTDHLFSGKDKFVEENCSVFPQNFYGKTKAQAELKVLEANPKALIIRTNFFGWGTSYRRSFSDFIIETRRDRKKIILFQDVYFTPIIAENLALETHNLIELNASGVFNIVSDERISKYHFGIMVAKEFNLNTSLIIPGLISDNTTLVRRPKDMSLSNYKARKLLNRDIGNVGQQVRRLYEQEQLGFSFRTLKI